jgi:signal transduction histidine kinase
VRTELQEGQVLFSVTDLGPGISKEHLERIFERFYRVDSDQHRASGTGLGLAICKRIVESHDGTIGVSSTPDVGTRFQFSLPLDGAAHLINRSDCT